MEYGALQFHRRRPALAARAGRRAPAGGGHVRDRLGQLDPLRQPDQGARRSARRRGWSTRTRWARAHGPRGRRQRRGAVVRLRTCRCSSEAERPRQVARCAVSRRPTRPLILRLGRRWVVSPAVRADVFSEQATTPELRRAAPGRSFQVVGRGGAEGQRRAIRADAQPACQRGRVRGLRSGGSGRANLGRRLRGRAGAAALAVQPGRHRLLPEAAAHRRAQHRHQHPHARSPPTSWCRAWDAPTASRCCCGARTSAACSDGSRTRSPGASATTTPVCSGGPTGTNGTS